MNGPQRTAVSRKELWQKRKQKEDPDQLGSVGLLSYDKREVADKKHLWTP